jgi:hypothetical protein
LVSYDFFLLFRFRKAMNARLPIFGVVDYVFLSCAGLSVCVLHEKNAVLAPERLGV